MQDKLVRLLSAFFKILVLLPKGLLHGLGVVLGFLAYCFCPKRRRIAKINLSRVFPDISLTELNRLVYQNFNSLGLGIIETFLAWFSPRDKLMSWVILEGLEHLVEAQKKSKGVLLAGPHLVTLELAGRFFSETFPLSAMYRRQNRGFFNAFMEKNRGKHYQNLIAKTDLKRMIRLLDQNQVIAYLADQAPPKKRRVYIPWFGIETAMQSALSDIVRLSGAVILPVSMKRERFGKYVLKIHPALVDFGLNEQADAKKIALFLENVILVCPEQYLWIHRCFKKLFDKKTNYYAQSALKPTKVNQSHFSRLAKFFKTRVAGSENLYKQGDGTGRYMLKIFSSRTSCLQAKQFIKTTNHLRSLGIDCPLVLRFYHITETNDCVLICRGITCDRAIDFQKIAQSTFQDLQKFKSVLASRGINLDKISPAHINLQKNGRFGVLDPSAITYTKGTLLSKIGLKCPSAG